MRHGLCVRGIAAASLALAATTASAAPPVATSAIGLPVVSSHSGALAAFVAARALASPVKATAAPAIPSLVSEPATSNTPSETKAAVELRQRLGELVGDHSAAFAPDEERGCLAGAVYFEARGEPRGGQLAVAEVVLNRAASGEYPASICEVVKQPAQFSFVRDGLFPPIDQTSAAWRTAVAIAQIADEKLANNLASDVLWYHADYVAPDWGRRLDRVTQIGAHVFYRRG